MADSSQRMCVVCSKWHILETIGIRVENIPRKVPEGGHDWARRSLRWVGD
jgi:hypothetical protein